MTKINLFAIQSNTDCFIQMKFARALSTMCALIDFFVQFYENSCKTKKHCTEKERTVCACNSILFHFPILTNFFVALQFVFYFYFCFVGHVLTLSLCTKYESALIIFIVYSMLFYSFSPLFSPSLARSFAGFSRSICLPSISSVY